MKLNHLNLTVTDLNKAQDFLTTFFGLRSMPWGDPEKIVFLHDDDDLILSLMLAPSASEAHYPGLFHIGFAQGSREEVDILHTRLQQAGFKIKPAREFHNAYTFYVNAPGGFMVEVLAS